MIKKLKLGLSFVVASVCMLGLASSAFAANLTFTDDTTVTLGGNNYTIQALSGATSVAISTDGTQLTVVTDGVTSFTLISPNGYLLTNNQSIAQSCTGSSTGNQNSATVSTALTTIFTPVATICSVTGGGGGQITGGGTVTPPPPSGGGGGSTYVPPATPPPTTLTITPATPTVVPPDTGCSGGNMVNSSTGQPCVNNTMTQIPGCGNGTAGVSPVTGQSCASNFVSMNQTYYNFGTVTLRNGSRGEAVKQLQMALNRILNLGLVVDGKLGPKTIAVIKTWQKAHGLVADGLVGPKTKAAINVEAMSQ